MSSSAKEFYRDPLVALYQGDVMDCLEMLASCSIQMVMTSPPYWQQRVYMYQGKELWGQWGIEEDWHEYISRMMEWSQAIRKVLRNNGALWLNIGNKYGVIDTSHATIPGTLSVTYDANRSKNLMGIPYRLVFRMCDEQGWVWRNEIPWYKPNAMPSSKQDALTPTWEPIFLLTKTETTKFRLDRIRVDKRGIDSKLKSEVVAKAPQYTQSTMFDFIHKDEQELGNAPEGLNPITSRLYAPGWKGARHKLGANPGDVAIDYEDWYSNQRDKIGYHGHEDDDVTGHHSDKSYAPVLTHPKGAAPADVFSSFESQDEDFIILSTNSGRRRKSKDRNYASFPEKLCVRPILVTSDPGDIVLDPFAGTGTVGVVAKRLGRRAVLFELNPRDCEEAAFRISEVPMPMESFIGQRQD